jgi:hypothetical protein
MDNQMVWSVYNLVRTVPDGVVITVNCTVSMTDGQHTVSGNINQNVPYKSPSDPDFIPFDELSESETIKWVQQQLGPTRINQMQRGLRQALDKQKVQTTSGLPW